ncbi:hypothetical protein TVAG_211940 [Trichomonas vaginalis G3]|uniref:Uncharacterized protein n=1 Tax=Trichomonas vaginalis (strain ATCC PRA-98 / G3) TaxID=412133 RepID=A2EIF0_TRIV3|nr:ribonuclease inhibitor domain-containing protein [Trichomonas vaginalis G3]EAY07555.1 hypothetical protein TVAG_211940 [Trichomonas vaginalis G3]KAI5541262.1 ribonuclease inhibitor domain-containing protein [Trichomonas vaginalis G3]|eukprot:XP_001319778.1 hypothetical protein [Trichomonas vaginalis G3]
MSSSFCILKETNIAMLTFHPFDTFAVPSDEIMRLICQSCPHLKNLSFAHSEEISTYWVMEVLKRLNLESSSALRLIAPHIGTLKMLCISECSKLTIPGVINFILTSKTLKVLKLEETGVNLPSGNVNPDVLAGIKDPFPIAKESSPGILFLQ